MPVGRGTVSCAVMPWGVVMVWRGLAVAGLGEAIEGHHAGEQAGGGGGEGEGGHGTMYLVAIRGGGG